MKIDRFDEFIEKVKELAKGNQDIQKLDELVKRIKPHKVGDKYKKNKKVVKLINEKVRKIFEEEKAVRSIEFIESIKEMMTIKTLKNDDEIVGLIKKASELTNKKDDEIIEFILIKGDYKEDEHKGVHNSTNNNVNAEKNVEDEHKGVHNSTNNNVDAEKNVEGEHKGVHNSTNNNGDAEKNVLSGDDIIENKVLKIVVREIRKEHPKHKLLEFIARVLSNETLGIGDKLFNLGEELKEAKKDENKDKEKTMFKCYKKSSELGHNEATWQVGLCYEKGNGVDEDSKKALEYYTLAEREKRYYYNNLKELFEKWKHHNYISNRNSIIAMVICLLSMVLGVILFINKSQVKNIVSTAAIGSGSTLTLAGSLASLKTLFQEFKNNKEGITEVRDLVEKLKYKSNEKGNEEIISEFRFNLDELRKHEKLNPLYFMEKLNRHMQYMLICRTMLVSLMSLVFIILTIIAVLALAVSSSGIGDDIFNIINIILISFSLFCLWCIISIRICIQIFIPRVIEQDENNIEKFANKIKINNICQTIGLKKRIDWGLLSWFCILYWIDWKRMSWLKALKISVFWFFSPTFVFLGLVSTDMRLKRISVRDNELDEINRILFGLPIFITI